MGTASAWLAEVGTTDPCIPTSMSPTWVTGERNTPGHHTATYALLLHVGVYRAGHCGPTFIISSQPRLNFGVEGGANTYPSTPEVGCNPLNLTTNNNTG